MARINLLPIDLTPKKSILRLAGALTKLSYMGIAIFIISVLTISGLYIINLTKINSIKKEEEVLINSVREYEQTEQQVVLAKDRMGKIDQIWEKNTAQNHIDVFQKLLSSITGGVTLKSIEITGSKTTISIDTNSSSSVSSFLGTLVSSNLYKSIQLTNFSFNPNYGYRIVFEASL